MQISISEDNVHFEPKKVKGINDLADVIKEKNYSLGVFKDNYRNRDNFVQAEAIGLDVDDGISIDEAIDKLKGYKCIVAPTKSHRKDKGGKVADRFRVILFLEEPITDIDDYYETWYSLQEEFPFIDKACKDPSRFYYPSKSTAKVRVRGRTIKPKKYVPKPEPEKVEVPDGARGDLSKETLEFLLLGKANGSRHDTLYKAAVDANEQGYSQDEFWGMVAANPKLSLFTDPTSDRNGEALRTVKDAFSKEPRHAPRLPSKAFNFMPIGEVLSTTNKLSWAVDGLLTEGGISVLAGDPKAGKSTIARQIAKAVVRGEKFLDRKAEKGPVLYLALEEQLSALNLFYKQMGMTKDDELYVHVGGALGGDTLRDLTEAIEHYKPRLIVADTMFLLLNVRDINSYKEVNDAVSPFRKIARDTDCHIMFLHHSNKSGIGANAVSGSKAITGAVDNIMLFERIDGERFLTTQQRVGKSITDQHLAYDEDKLEYKLGTLTKAMKKDEF